MFKAENLRRINRSENESRTQPSLKSMKLFMVNSGSFKHYEVGLRHYSGASDKRLQNISVTNTVSQIQKTCYSS